MGYMVFQEDIGSAATAQPFYQRVTGTPGSDCLSPLEWSVVGLARGDDLSTLRNPGRISIAMGILFGKRYSARLACPRLEALRRIAVLSWHRGFAVHGQEVEAFTAAGFTLHQLGLVVASIIRARAALANSRRTWGQSSTSGGRAL
ncbi:MAG: hypothetical protein ACSLE1_18125 [Sphingobium sp.]